MSQPFRFAKAKLPPGATLSGPDAEERVTSIIVDAILNHKIAPGVRLVERELGQAAGANRSAIRNSLLKLAQVGLVEISPNRGASVATCTPEEARHLFDARVVIESSAIGMLASNFSPSARARLEEAVREEGEAYAAGRMEEARHLSRRFHLLLAELAGNPVLAGFVRDMINRQPLLSWTRPLNGPRFCGNDAHRAIVDALVRGDGAAAIRLNAEHLRELEEELSVDAEKQRDNSKGEQIHEAV